MYEVVLSPKAQKSYIKSDSVLSGKIDRCLLQLEQDPRNHSNIKPLKGNFVGFYRYRIGNYRVLYRVDDERVQVFVESIRHRSKIYE